MTWPQEQRHGLLQIEPTSPTIPTFKENISGSTFQAAYTLAPAIDSFHVAHRLSQRDLPPEPRNYEEVLSHPYKDQFLMAMREEMNSINRMQTAKIINRSEAKGRYYL